ncbi:MAG: transglutaminase-like domain-containing protein, partial [Gemmataceae bacterium]
AFHTVRTVKLTVKRYGSVMPIEIEQTCDETADGKVLALGLNQSLGKDKQSAVTARVEGKKLHLESGKAKRSQPWDEACLGLYAQEQAFARRKAKPGDKFSLASFELSAEIPLTLRVEVKGEENVDRMAAAGDGVKREPAKLVRAEITTDKIFVGGTEVQLPPKTAWLDGDGQTVREQFEFPGLGVITQFTTTREAAQKEGIAPDLLPDLGTNIMIPLNKEIARPYDAARVVYRVSVDAPGKPPFVTDERQEVKLPLGKTFELWVTSVREPGRDEKAASPGTEFTESNRFIDSDSPVIRALARRAAGGEKKPHALALKLEKWVHENMRFDAGVGFPPASQTAGDLKGDCRQHALLLAALLRASDVPARTALGLIYTREPGKGPVFAFHMWTEAYLGGRWVALDAIQGKGFVGATHLTMVQHSWAGTQTLAPLLPIAGVLGKVKIDVLDAR